MSVYDSPVTDTGHAVPERHEGRSALSLATRLGRRAVLHRLEALADGELTIVEADERQRFGRPGPDALAATVTVRDPRFWSALARGGTVGAGEAYAAGWWDADDLVTVVRLIARNRAVNRGLDAATTLPRRLLGRLTHLARANSRAGSRRNIAAHYDLGNEFFSLFLDSSLTYSSAIFPSPGVSLERAQREKLDRICRALALAPGDEVVEIGTGWGSFALHAAGEYGCHVTTTTISAEQHTFARERIDAAGLADRVSLLQADYRDLPGLVRARSGEGSGAPRRFDKLVSIEMIEAVGEAYLDPYLGVLQELLAPDGVALVQAILMADRHYDEYRREPDFMQRLVFPGSHLPALSDLLARAARVTDFTLAAFDDITPHYAETLARWRERFVARRRQVRELGFSESFRRLWELYLSYCEGGFREGVVRDAQILLARPGALREGTPFASLGGG